MSTQPDPAEDPEHTDRAFREIVARFGERPVLPETDAQPSPEPGEPAETAEQAEQVGTAETGDPDHRARIARERELAESFGDQDTFVPPDPGPFPMPPPDRLIAWIGVLGMPALAVLAILTSTSLPVWWGTAMVVWFVGGFVYLVATMGEPPDPYDDGSRV